MAMAMAASSSSLQTGSNGEQPVAKRRKIGTGREDTLAHSQSQHFAIGPNEDDPVIRQRLITRTSTTRGEPPLKKLLKKFFAFSGEVEKENVSNIPDCEKLYRAFLQEFSSFELPLLKTKVVIGANHREQESFKELQAQLSLKIVEAQGDIEELKAQLEESKIERQHKEECEAVRRLIGAQPARSETQKALDELSREVADLESENITASRTLELRKKQFSLLLHVVDDLQTTLEDELKASAEESKVPPEDSKAIAIEENNGSADPMQTD